MRKSAKPLISTLVHFFSFENKIWLRGDYLLGAYVRSSPECSELFALLAAADKDYAHLWRLADIFAILISQTHASTYAAVGLHACQKVRVDMISLIPHSTFALASLFAFLCASSVSYSLQMMIALNNPLCVLCWHLLGSLLNAFSSIILIRFKIFAIDLSWLVHTLQFFVQGFSECAFSRTCHAGVFLSVFPFASVF